MFPVGMVWGTCCHPHFSFIVRVTEEAHRVVKIPEAWTVDAVLDAAGYDCALWAPAEAKHRLGFGAIG